MQRNLRIRKIKTKRHKTTMEEKIKRSRSGKKKQEYVFYNHRRATPAVFMGIVLFLCISILFGIVIGIRSSIKISSVKISGETQYTENDLLVASGIKLGDKIHKIDVGKAKGKILDACPYLSDVQILKAGKGVLTFKVKESVPEYYLLSGNSAFVLDDNFRLLEISEDVPLWQEKGIIKISASNLSYTKLGAPIKFGGENALSIDKVSDILSKIKDFLYADEVDHVSFDDKYEIYFTCGDKFKILLGDSGDISAKLKKAGQMMKIYENSNEMGLVVNVYNLDEPFVGSR